MSHQFSGWVMRTTLVMALLSGLWVPAAGQSPRGPVSLPMEPYGQLAGCSEEPAQFHRCALAKAKGFEPSRGPDGKPDFRGFWSRAVVRGTSDIEEHAEGLGDSGGYSQVVDPADGKIPYQPWASAKKRDHFATYNDPAVLCVQPGVPRQAYTAGVNQILQTADSLIFLSDYAHAYRIIPIDGRPHLGSNIHLFMGSSRGRFEGNTLIVDVTNQIGRTWLDHVGNFFSDAVHVVERWTFFDANAIHYEATIDDPKVYTRPWTIVSGMRRTTEPGYEIWENACHEGSTNLSRTEIGLKQYFGVTPPK
jgi:hypothetical protein